MWTYRQSTGLISHDGTDIQIGYSGHGSGLNNPRMQDFVAVGPIPRGRYTIGPEYVHEHLGRNTMNLEPHADNQMFGRSEFRIHGDNSQCNHTASEGCIILGHTARCVIGASVEAGDDQLTVIE
jgi:hypothetical protein